MRKGHWKCVTITLDCTAFSFLIWINLTSKQDNKGWKNRSTDRKFSRKYSRKSSFEVLFAGGRVIEQRPQGREREKAQNGRFSAILRRASATQSGERLGICLSKKKQSFIDFPRPRRHEGYMHKRRKWPLKGWTKRCHNSFSWAYLTAWSTFETLHFPGTFYWKEGALLMASLRWPELLKDWIHSCWKGVMLQSVTHSSHILRLFFLCFHFIAVKPLILLVENYLSNNHFYSPKLIKFLTDSNWKGILSDPTFTF